MDFKERLGERDGKDITVQHCWNRLKIEVKKVRPRQE